MLSSGNGRLHAFLISVVLVTTTFGAAAPVTLTSRSGATARFEQRDGGGWAWTAVATAAPVGTVAIEEVGYRVVGRAGTDESDAPAEWRLGEATTDKVVLEHEFTTAGLALRRIFRFGAADNVVRMETWARSTGGSNELTRLSFVRARVAGESFRESGGAGQSFPLLGRQVFLGLEHVSGECHAADDLADVAQSPHLSLGSDWRMVGTVVLGWVAPTVDLAPGEAPIRGAFLHYLDTVRIKPADLELHTNTWWTLPLPFSEQDVLRDIAALREGFYERTGMFFDSYALDLGWSDRHSIWRFDEQRFPTGFTNINARLAEMGCKLGLWISPGSAYPEGLENAWLTSQGYEVTPSDGPDGVVACFGLGGRYQTQVKEGMVDYAREYGLGHVKLDYMSHTCDVPTHGHPVGGADSEYAIEGGLADLLDSLRAVNPKMALEPLVCGTPPSPWWTMHTPYLLGPHGDDVPFGRVPSLEWMESLTTGRDVAYRARQEDWLVPTQALETFDIVVQCPGDFKNMAVMAIGRGRWFISTYLKPDYMRPEDWDFLAGLVRWARANKQYLGNAQMIGGRPEQREAYGYLFHHADKDIYCLRNPWIEPRTIELPAGTIAASRDLRMLYPRHAMMARIDPGSPPQQITLAPYETVVLDTVPTNPRLRIRGQPARPTAAVSSATRTWGPAGDGSSSRYTWDATVTIPDTVTEGELCILVEGDPAVKDATCQLSVSGAHVQPVKSGSAGQFAAAGGEPVENWTWFRQPLNAGSHLLHLDLQIPLRAATVGVYVRGVRSANHDTSWTDAVPFPEVRPELRPWSQTLCSESVSLSAATGTVVEQLQGTTSLGLHGLPATNVPEAVPTASSAGSTWMVEVWRPKLRN